MPVKPPPLKLTSDQDDKSAPETTVAELELYERETEFFQFSPVSFVDDVVSAINTYMFSAAEAVTEFAKKYKPPLPEKSIQKGVNQMIAVMEGSIDKSFDKFELYVLKNIFKIPNNVTLLQHRKLNLSYTMSMESQLDEQVEALRTRVLSQRCINAFLKKELEAIDDSLADYKAHKQSIEQLLTVVKRGSHVKETIRFLDDQVKELHQLTRSVDDLQRVALRHHHLLSAGNANSLLSALGIPSPIDVPSSLLQQQISLQDLRTLQKGLTKS